MSAETPTSQQQKLTLKTFAAKKLLPHDFLTAAGLVDSGQGLVIPYGPRLRDRVRLTMTRAADGPDKRFIWAPGPDPVGCYTAAVLPDELRPRGPECYLLEGESDSLTMWYAGVPAVGIPGSQMAGKLRLDHVADFVSVNIWQEPGEAGATFAAKVAERLTAIGYPGFANVVTARGDKDPSDLWGRVGGDRGAFFGELVRLHVEAKAKPETAPKAEKAAGPPPWKFKPMTTPELMRADYSLSWLVEGCFVDRQPILIGGPKKTLKTSIALDLAVSLATRTQFLDRFRVPAAKRVLVISGESGGATLRNTYRQICDARDLPHDMDGLFWQFETPKLGACRDLEELTRGLRELAIDVCILDPMYLMILAGASMGIKTENVMQFGPLVKAANDACLTASALPVTLHHAKKLNSRQNGYEALDMDDLTGTGFAEHARQWLLLGRREKYDASGVHRLFMAIGGSVGHAAEYALDIDEGLMGADFGGKKWHPNVMNVGQVIEAKKTKQAEQEDAAATRKLQEDVDAIVRTVDRLARTDAIGRGNAVEKPPIAGEIKSNWGRTATRFQMALNEAVSRKQIAPVTVSRTIGAGNKTKRECIAYRRPPKVESCVPEEV